MRFQPKINIYLRNCVEHIFYYQYLFVCDMIINFFIASDTRLFYNKLHSLKLYIYTYMYI